jgi:hypothetical protein
MRMKFALVVIALFIAVAYADMGPPIEPVSITDFIPSLLITIIVELIVSYLYLRYKKQKNFKMILLSVIVANIISVSLFWLLFPPYALLFNGSPPTGYSVYFVAIVVPELVIIAFEAVVMFLMNRKRLKFKDALVMSFLNNLATTLIWVALILFHIYENPVGLFRNVMMYYTTYNSYGINLYSILK